MRADSDSDYFVLRQGRLRALMEGRGLPLLLLTSPVNIFYLTGFRGSAGVAAFGLEGASLWVDPRYTLQAEEQARGAKVIEERKGLLKAVAGWLRGRGACRVGYEDTNLSCAQFRELKSEAAGRVRFHPTGGIVEELRLVKDQNEIALIRRQGRSRSSRVDRCSVSRVQATVVCGSQFNQTSPRLLGNGFERAQVGNDRVTSATAPPVRRRSL